MTQNFRFLVLSMAAALAVFLIAVPARAGTAEDVVRFTNEERAAEGLSGLKIDKALMKAAAQRARECASRYSHDRPDGSKCFTVLEEYGVSYSSAAENIYQDNFERPSGARAVGGWMNSPGHRANILDGDYTHIGVGVYSAGGNNYLVQLFIKK
jgi:uncharacterized protein YkwD